MITNYRLVLPEGYVKPELPFRDKWCAELQSGTHRQIRGRLHSEEGQCCLGVICEAENLPYLIFPDTDPGDRNTRSYCGSSSTITNTNPLFEYLSSTGSFPESVRVEFGCDLYRNAKVFTLNTLTGLNDGGFTFDQIARIIKRVWSQPQY